MRRVVAGVVLALTPSSRARHGIHASFRDCGVARSRCDGEARFCNVEQGEAGVDPGLRRDDVLGGGAVRLS